MLCFPVMTLGGEIVIMPVPDLTEFLALVEKDMIITGGFNVYSAEVEQVRSFVKDRLGSVKAPKQVEVWPDLPRSKVGKILKVEVKARLRDRADLPYPQDHLSERGWYVPRSASSFRPGRS